MTDEHDLPLKEYRRAGLEITSIHGVRTFGDLVPGAMIDGEADALDELLTLEAATSERPAFRAIAAQLHVVARRPDRSEGAGTTA